MPKSGEYDNSYPFLLETENNIKLLESFKGAKQHHKMKCLVCNHKWTATPLSKRQTFKKYGVGGCPECTKKLKRERNQNIHQKHVKDLEERGIIILTPNFKSLRTTSEKLRFKNIHCGHIFDAHPGNMVTRKNDCVICGIKNRTNVVNAWSKENSRKWRETADEWQKYKSDVSKLTEQNYNKYKKLINPKKLPRGIAGNKEAYHLDHIVPKRFCFDNNIPVDVCASPDNLQMIHWTDNVGSRNHLKGAIPHLFLQYISDDTRIQSYIDILQQTFPLFSTYVNVNGVTATLYDENSKTAILIIPTTKSFANQKTGKIAAKAWNEVGVKYFVIFEDEISQKKDLVLNKISHYMNHSNIVDVVYARKCVIKVIDSVTKRNFLNVNHIQGNDNAQILYGAFYREKLIAVMSFTKPRVALGYKDKDRSVYEGTWELSRFATDVNVRVPGIASKLLKHFQRQHNNWVKIISYADARWSSGNLYDVLGFEREVLNPPDYFYVIDGQRKHRWNYRKDILKTKFDNYDSTITEYDNMVNNGFWRVWDCGTMRYVLIK